MLRRITGLTAAAQQVLLVQLIGGLSWCGQSTGSPSSIVQLQINVQPICVKGPTNRHCCSSYELFNLLSSPNHTVPSSIPINSYIRRLIGWPILHRTLPRLFSMLCHWVTSLSNKSTDQGSHCNPHFPRLPQLPMPHLPTSSSLVIHLSLLHPQQQTNNICN